ncbi:hypothetical protein pipiens_000804, partial [Culex pipiens pipiens]
VDVPNFCSSSWISKLQRGVKNKQKQQQQQQQWPVLSRPPEASEAYLVTVKLSNRPVSNGTRVAEKKEEYAAG